jgi:CBS domain-containing protein
MSNVDHWRSTSEAKAKAPGSGLTARFESALARYLQVMSGATGAMHEGNAELVDELVWNMDYNVVCDVMTTDVVSVTADTHFKDIVELLSANRLSALPVLDTSGTVIGVVSESDLLAKVELANEPKPRRSPSRAATHEWRKAQAVLASDLMTAPAVTVTRNTTISDAARIAARARVHRLPVVDSDGNLLGIVSRSDLIKVFLRGDDAIRARILNVISRQFLLDPRSFDVTVEHGEVHVNGQVERRRMIEPLLDALRHVAGVVALTEHLSYRIDDTLLPPPRTPYGYGRT